MRPRAGPQLAAMKDECKGQSSLLSAGLVHPGRLRL